MDSQKATVPEGSFKIIGKQSMAIIRGIVIGRVNCWASVSTSINAPTAPNKERNKK